MTIKGKDIIAPGRKQQAKKQEQPDKEKHPEKKEEKKPKTLKKFFSMFKKKKEQPGKETLPKEKGYSEESDQSEIKKRPEKEETSKKEEQPDKEEQQKKEEQTEKEKQPGKKAQKKPKKWKRHLRILNIITSVVILFLVALAGYFALEPAKWETSVEQSKVDPRGDFFDSSAAYYIKTADLDDELREYIENKMESLKMDRGSVKEFLKKEFLNKLDIAESSRNSEKAKQYLFYKTNDRTIYTFIKSEEEVEAPPALERIEIRILEAQNPNKFWGIFQLEKDGKNAFPYTLKYIKGKFNKNTGRPLSYKPFDLSKKRKKLDNIIKVFVEAIQKTIKQNPRNALSNGEILQFEFYLSRKNENEKYTKVKSSGLSLPLKEKRQEVSTRNDEGEVISNELKVIGYWIDEDRKISLERELGGALKDLFSDETQPQKIIIYPLKIYKDGKTISEPGYSGGRIKNLLESSRKDSFQEWLKIFESEFDRIKLVNLSGYMINKSNKLLAPKSTRRIGIKEILRPKVIYVVIVIIIVTLFYFLLRGEIKPEKIKDEIKSKKGKDWLEKWYKGEKLEEHELREITPGEPGQIPGKKEIEPETTETTTEEKELDKAESRKKELTKYHRFEAKRLQLIEVHRYLVELKQIATNNYTIDQLENVDKLRVADNLVKEILKIEPKETNQETFDSKLNLLQKTIEEFKTKNKNKNLKIDDYLDKIEKGFEKFEKSETLELTEEEPPAAGVVFDVITETITNNNKLLRYFAGLSKKLNDKYQVLVEKIKNSLPDKDKEEFDPEDYAFKILRLPLKNNQLLEKIDKNIDTITNQFKYGHKLDQILSYLNRETDIYVTRENVLEIIEKVSSEEKTSKEYRDYALRLCKDLSDLEKVQQQDAWYWSLLADGLLSKLRENINFFSQKNEGARTIYDRHLEKEILLCDIEHQDIKKIIEQHHWVQIWDVLIRMNDFFAAYFDDETADIKTVLAYFSQKIKVIFGKLGYEIIHTKPLYYLSDEDRKSWDSEQTEKPFIEKFIIKNLVKSGNKKFLAAVENIPGDREMVVYVESLGLVDKLPGKPITITNLQFGAYNQDILHSYISSL